VSPAEFERLRSWTLEIAAELLPSVKWRDEDDERRFLGQGGFSVNRPTGAWFSQAASKGGRSPISLIMFLAGLDYAATLAWAENFLETHPGTGSCDGGTDHPEHPGSRAAALEIAEKLTDPAGTPAELYLRSRRLEPPYPQCVAFLPHARIGEGAVVGKLTANGRIVGFQLLYIDPDGRKSVVEPPRRRLMLDKCPEAAFSVPGTGGILIAEGLEDVLSLAALRRPEQLMGLPGIGSLQHFKVAKGDHVVVLRDGDEPNSAADKALRRGTDALLLQKAEVDVTPTPLGQDANSILQGSGPEALTALIDSAAPAELSRDGVILWLAGLDKLTYEEQRKRVALKLGIRVGTLDRAVGEIRTLDEEAVGSSDTSDDDLLDEEIDLAATLDEILAELRRYIVASNTLLGTTALWAAHTHVVHHERVRLTVSPRLAIQARDAGCGKTIVLECMAALVANPRMAASVTASSVLRVIDALQPTFLVDEADQLLHYRNANPDLLAVLNASHRRTTAFVERSVQTPDGNWVVQRFKVWGAMALASIGELPRTQQDRAIRIHLLKALAKDIPEHLEDGTSEKLEALQKKLRTWAAYLEELPRPAMPDLLMRQAGRVLDNWRPLIAIADVAGGRWPKLARDAVTEAVEAEKRPSRIQRLLISIRKAFDTQCESTDAETGRTIVVGPFERLETPVLIETLIDDEDEEWATANRGRAINAYWLRDNMRDLLDPPGSQQWETTDNGARCHRRGYERHQFEKAFAAYLPDYIPPTPRPPSGVTGERGSYGGDVPESSKKPKTYDNGPATPDGEDPRSSGGNEPVAEPFPPDQTPLLSSGETSGNGQGIDILKYFSTSPPDEPLSPHTPDAQRGYDGQGRFPDNVEQAAKHLSAQHPNWSVTRIAREIGQPPARIHRYIGASPQSATEARRLLDHWVAERFAILQRRNAGQPQPWTDDEILATHRFCNVRRQDDAGTLWVSWNISKAYAGNEYLWLMLCAARLVNWPPSIEALMAETGAWPGPQFDPQVVAAVLQRRLGRGDKTFSTAYGRGTLKSPKYIAEILGEQFRNHARMLTLLRQPGTRLATVHAELSQRKGWGGDGFLAYQVLVDLRFTPFLSDAPDRESWCAAGPGTLRGINRMLGRRIDYPLTQAEALDYIRNLYAELRRDFGEINFDLSDVCNVLCETDKYLRAYNKEPGTSLRRYNPKQP
jgi:putative DNA primase/helicase